MTEQNPSPDSSFSSAHGMLAFFGDLFPQIRHSGGLPTPGFDHPGTEQRWKIRRRFSMAPHGACDSTFLNPPLFLLQNSHPKAHQDTECPQTNQTFLFFIPDFPPLPEDSSLTSQPTQGVGLGITAAARPWKRGKNTRQSLRSTGCAGRPRLCVNKT